MEFLVAIIIGTISGSLLTPKCEEEPVLVETDFENIENESQLAELDLDAEMLVILDKDSGIRVGRRPLSIVERRDKKRIKK